MKKFIEIDYSIHKVLAVIVPLAVITFYFWLFIGPLCYLYVTFSDIVNLTDDKTSKFNKYRRLHLFGGISYLIFFFLLPLKNPEFLKPIIDVDYFMLFFWYVLPLCFFFLHFTLTRKNYYEKIVKY